MIQKAAIKTMKEINFKLKWNLHQAQHKKNQHMTLTMIKDMALTKCTANN